MIRTVRALATLVLLSMLGVTFWASREVPLWQLPHAVLAHPWFIATLFDCYFALLTFYVWVVYRERSGWTRLAWLFAILALGNIAMASYLLIALWRLPPDASFAQLLLRPEAARATR